MALEGDRFDELVEHRRWLDTCKQSASKDRDKTVLTIAGGSMAISISLLERVVPMTDMPSSMLLFAGWTLEIIAMWAILASIQSSESAFDAEIYRTDHMLRTPGHEDPGWPNASAKRTQSLNSAAPFIALIGVLLLLLHSAIAMTSPATHKEKTNADATANPGHSNARSSDNRRPDTISPTAGTPATQEVVTVVREGENEMANQREIAVPSQPVIIERGMVPSSAPPARPVAQSTTATTGSTGQQGSSGSSAPTTK